MKPRIASITGLLTLIGALAIVAVAFWAWSASGEREARPSDDGVVSNDSDSPASDTGAASASKWNELSADRAVLVLPLSIDGAVDLGALGQAQLYLERFGHTFTPGKLDKYSSCDFYVELSEAEVVDFIYEMRTEMPAFSGAGDRGLQRLLRCVRFAPDPTSGKYPQWLASEGAESYVRRIWHDERERPGFDVEAKRRACHESGPEQVLLELAWEGDELDRTMMGALNIAVKALRLPFSRQNKTDFVRLTEGQLESMVKYLAPGLREGDKGVEDFLGYTKFTKGSNQASWPEWSEGGQVGFVVRRMWDNALSSPRAARQVQDKGNY